MQKENVSTLALMVFLILLIIGAVYFQKQQALMATRPDIFSVVAKALNTDYSNLNNQKALLATNSGTCPSGCVATQNSTKTTKAEKAAWQADPVSRLTTVLHEKFAPKISQGELEQANFVNDQLWWRSEKEDYRILVPAAKVTGFQVATTQTALELAPKKSTDTHPAARHPLLKKVIKAINKEMSNLGYKKSKFINCPVNEAYDPFNNCLATYTKDNHKCTLIAGYGRLDRQASTTPFLRVELACSDDYEDAYQLAQPYLYSLNMINPEWHVPDMAVYNVITSGDWSRVSFGSNYGIFQKITSGYKLIAGGINPVSCLVAQTNSIPQEIYRECR